MHYVCGHTVAPWEIRSVVVDKKVNEATRQRHIIRLKGGALCRQTCHSIEITWPMNSLQCDGIYVGLTTEHNLCLADEVFVERIMCVPSQ